MRLTGLEVDYDYLAKNAVRSHWVSFAARGVSPSMLKQLSVWFLPGHQALEVSAYEEAGISRKQLVGFEYYDDRASQIRKRYPGLRLTAQSFAEALADSNLDLPNPDWANLDFDGSILSFTPETSEVVRRLRLSHAPRLAISSLGSRDRLALIESVKTLSLWAAINPRLFETCFDLLRTSNEHQGLILEEPGATYMLCRELAASLVVMRSFGERAYGDADRRSAHAFAERFAEYEQTVTREVEEKILSRLGQPTALPLASLYGFGDFIAARKIPVSLDDRLRFAYRSTSDKWRWTWYYRIRAGESISLAEWVRQLFYHHPPLHVVDFTGAVVGNRSGGVCPLCVETKGAVHGERNT